MIKKKIAIAVLAVAIVGVFGMGAINAYFNDTETSAGNSFTAGTLDLTVNAQNPWTGTAFTLADLRPGSSAYSTMVLTNSGSIGGALTGGITAISNGPGTTPEPEAALLTPDLGELSANMEITVWMDTNNNGVIDGGETVLYDDTLSAASGSWNLGTLGPAATTFVSISYEIPTSVGNVIMGDTCTFTIGYTLTQT